MTEEPVTQREDEPAAGIPVLDAAAISASLRELSSRPIDEHPAVFADVHTQLQAALQQLDSA